MNNNFTITVPIKDEVQRLKKTLPTLYALNPGEVIVCTDKPSPKNIVKAVAKLSKEHNMEEKTKILEVERNPEYSYHQAWVRRSGFRAAKYDIILNTDIDIYLNKNVLKAIKLAGKNEVGMVTLEKFRNPYNFLMLFRTWGMFFLILLYTVVFRFLSRSSSGLNFSLFSGLYALYRPYWLDAEKEEELKVMTPPYYKEVRKLKPGELPLGEDVFLRDQMIKKYKVLTLGNIGGTVMDREFWIKPEMQFIRGRLGVQERKSFFGAIAHMILHAEPSYLKGYIFEKRRLSL